MSWGAARRRPHQAIRPFLTSDVVRQQQSDLEGNPMLFFGNTKMPRRGSAVFSKLGCAVISVVLAFPLFGITASVAGTPSTCESLTSFAFPDTTINYALANPGGAYVAPDAWHLAFTNL